MPVGRQAFIASLCIAAFAGLTIGGLGGCVAGYQIGKGNLSGTVTDKSRVYTRDEFRKLVMGKTPEEVVQLLGRPVSTSDSGDGQPSWYYENRSRDPVTGKLDTSISLHFANGVVVTIYF